MFQKTTIAYLHESDFNVGQVNDSSYFSEAVSCSDSDKWAVATEEVKICAR